MKRQCGPSKRNERLAHLVADDELSDDQIAAAVGMGRSGLSNIKRQPEFIKRVNEIVTAYRQQLMQSSIADPVKRMRAADERWKGLQQIKEERAADQELHGIPGATTGLIVKQIRGIGKGDDYQVVEEYAIDTGLLKEFRAIEEQASIEVEKWQLLTAGESKESALPLVETGTITLTDQSGEPSRAKPGSTDQPHASPDSRDRLDPENRRV